LRGNAKNVKKLYPEYLNISYFIATIYMMLKYFEKSIHAFFNSKHLFLLGIMWAKKSKFPTPHNTAEFVFQPRLLPVEQEHVRPVVSARPMGMDSKKAGISTTARSHSSCKEGFFRSGVDETKPPPTFLRA